MKKDIITLNLNFFILLFLSTSCNTTKNTRDDIKINNKGEITNSTFITGNNTNNYNNILEIHNHYKDSIEMDDKKLDSIIKSIKNLESKLSVLSDIKLNKEEKSQIQKEIIVNQKEYNRINSVREKHYKNLQLQKILLYDFEQTKKNDTLSKVNIGQNEYNNVKNNTTILNDSSKVNILNDNDNKYNGGALRKKFDYNNLSKDEIIKNLTLYTEIYELANQNNEILNQQLNEKYQLLTNAHKTNDDSAKKLINVEIEKIQEKQSLTYEKMQDAFSKKTQLIYLHDKNYLNLNELWKENKIAYPKDGEELLEALKDNTTIILNEKEYNISPLVGKNVSNPSISYSEDIIYINNLKNFQIISNANFTTHLFSNILDTPVLNFRNCENFKLYNLRIGHDDKAKYSENIYCGVEGDVIELNECKNIVFDKLQLYGCGTQGLDIINSGNITVNDTEIYKCTNGVASFYNSFNINFNFCTFRDNLLNDRSIFEINNESKNIYIYNSNILRNKKDTMDYNGYNTINIISGMDNNVYIENTIFKDNDIDFICPTEKSFESLNVTLMSSDNVIRKGKYSSK